VWSSRSGEVTGGEGGDGVAHRKPAQRQVVESGSDRIAADGSTLRACQSRDLGVARNMLALQRACGNRAVAGLLRDPIRTEPGDVAVQRYAPKSLEGEMDWVVAGARSKSGGVAPGSPGNQAGFTGTANVGWIQLGTASINEEPHIARSEHPTRHTEEVLVAWAEGQVPNVKLAHDDPSPDRRVKRLYTERIPCTTQSADAARKQRPYGNCHAYLTNKLHAQVPVLYSVTDGTAPHATMLAREKAKKFVLTPNIQRVHAAANNKIRNYPAGRAEICHLRDVALAKIKALPLPHQDPDFQGYPAKYSADVKTEADAGIAAITAWNPPPSIVVPDQQSGPPDREDDGQSGKRPATSDKSDGDKRPRLAPAVNG
jgi:hypothetical protein